MRKRTSSRVVRLLATCLALAIVASVATVAVGAGPASAAAPSCYATVQGTSIDTPSASNCYYVVVRQSDWKKVCEGPATPFSCNNLNNGKYQVQAYSRSPWKHIATNTLTVATPPGTGGGCDNLINISGDIGGGHADGSCYYVVTNTSTWSRACAGTLFDRGCAGRFDDLAPGRYKVDVYATGPWKKLNSHYLTVR